MTGSKSSASAGAKKGSQAFSASDLAEGDLEQRKLAVDVGNQHCQRVCNPQFDRPFTSAEDVLDCLLPYHIFLVEESDGEEAEQGREWAPPPPPAPEAEAPAQADVKPPAATQGPRPPKRSRFQKWVNECAAKLDEFDRRAEASLRKIEQIAKRQRTGHVAAQLEAEEACQIEYLLLADRRENPPPPPPPDPPADAPAPAPPPLASTPSTAAPPPQPSSAPPATSAELPPAATATPPPATMPGPPPGLPQPQPTPPLPPQIAPGACHQSGPAYPAPADAAHGRPAGGQGGGAGAGGGNVGGAGKDSSSVGGCPSQ